MIKKLFIISLIVFSQATCAAEKDPVMDYVSNLIDQTFSILKDASKDLTSKVKDSEKLIEANMDLNWMAKFTLGRYRRTLTPEQLADFEKQYSEYVVKVYGSAVKGYTDQDLKVKSKVEINKGEYAVKTQLIKVGADPINIDYLIREVSANEYKVFDVVTEGVSLINSHQAEFANIISNNGYDSLKEEINRKIAKLDGNTDVKK